MRNDAAWIRQAIVAGVCALLASGCAPRSRVVQHEESASPATASAAAPATTQADGPVLSPTVDVELSSTHSTIWCATFQLAYDALGRTIGKPLALESDNPQATALATSYFPPKWIGDAGFAIFAGHFDAAMCSRIQIAARQHPSAALDGLAAKPPNPLDLVAVATLAKQVDFALPFELDEQPIRFATADVAEGAAADFGTPLHTPVKSFGIDRLQANARVADQVRVLWVGSDAEVENASENTYVLELQTTAPADRLIVARLGRPGSLRVAITEALSLMRRSNTIDPLPAAELNQLLQRVNDNSDKQAMDELEKHRSLANRLANNESFHMPVIRLAADRRFSQIEGARDGFWKLLYAAQNVRFDLNERGATLQSSAALEGALLGNAPREFYFDEPFLVMLMRHDAPWPYFALWVAGKDVLVPTTQPVAASDAGLPQ